MSSPSRSVRLSQTITPFGVGAIYDLMGESFILCDVSVWTQSQYSAKGRRIEHPRLSMAMGGVRFHEAKSKAEFFGSAGGQLPFYRFPRWLFCPKCRRMVYRTMNEDVSQEVPVCSNCRGRKKLVPMRFIAVCENGHADDIWWPRWAHSGSDNVAHRTCGVRNQLTFRARSGSGGGLSSLEIRCEACGARRSLDRLTSPDTLKTIGQSCSGKQPWQNRHRAVDCDCQPQAIQRGASNAYYPQIRSAIWIPRREDAGNGRDDLGQRLEDNPLYSSLTSGELSDDQRDSVLGVVAQMLGATPEEIERCLGVLNGELHSGDDSQVDPVQDEWLALSAKNPAEYASPDFSKVRHDLAASGSQSTVVRKLDALLEGVFGIRRLREVRVLEGFYRYKPGGDDHEAGGQLVPANLGSHPDWLPAMEVFGEGIFLQFNEEKLSDWESQHLLTQRARSLDGRREAAGLDRLLPDATARYIMLHTFAHMLIRQLSFDCGYSSAALRERVYARVDDEGRRQAGILIYTSDGDSEGTLGGLARQAKPARILQTIISALQNGSNCSNDPVCMESTGQGMDGLNLAGCHACSLVSETSCTGMNLLLDRMMVFGPTEGDAFRGYFQELLEHSAQLS